MLVRSTGIGTVVLSEIYLLHGLKSRGSQKVAFTLDGLCILLICPHLLVASAGGWFGARCREGGQ